MYLLNTFTRDNTSTAKREKIEGQLFRALKFGIKEIISLNFDVS